MVDWQAVAVFLAGATWLATSLFGQPLDWFRDWISWALLNHANQCEAICWRNLPMKIAPHGPATRTDSMAFNNDDGEQTPDQILATTTFLGVIGTMFGVSPVRTKRPRYLEERKNYIRTDGNTLLAFLLSSSALGGGRLRSESGGSHLILTFSAGSVSGRFHRHHDKDEMYIVGRLLEETPVSKWKIRHAVYGLPKEALRLIADGYPPFYRDRFTTHSGTTISHPVKTLRGVCRGGWIIAIGLSIHEPVRKYNGGYMSQYAEACNRVLKTLEKAIWPCFVAPSRRFEICNQAVQAIRRMNGNRSGSGLPTFTADTIFHRCHQDDPGADPLSAEQSLFAMRLFDENREEPLTGDDRTDLEAILVPVLCAAINGIYKWWQYVNNEGSELPNWLLDDRVRYAPIWIEA